MRRLLVPTIILAAALAGGCNEDKPLAPGQAVSLRGEIAAGVECPMLVASNGRRFSLAGSIGQFKPGDRVCVKGRVAEVSYCMAGEATVSVETIDAEGTCP